MPDSSHCRLELFRAHIQYVIYTTRSAPDQQKCIKKKTMTGNDPD